MTELKRYVLSDVAEICNHKRVPLNSQERERRKGPFPYYGASGVVDFVDDYLFDGEYVLISEDGENLRSRKTPIAFKANGRFWVNNHAHIVRGIKPFLNDWLVYYFSVTDINPYLTGAVQPKLSKENLLSIPIYIPEFSKAETITEILSSLDDKIELNNQINQNLEALAQAIFKRWFVDFEFPNENGQPYKSSGGEMVESELGQTPCAWHAGTLGDVLSVVNGFAFKSSDFREKGEDAVIKIKNINGRFVDVNNTQFIPPPVANSTDEKFRIREGDILIAMTGAEVGKIAIVPPPSNQLWLNQRVGKLQPKIPNSSIFIRSLFAVHNLTAEVRNSAMGSAQPNISGSSIEAIKTCIPDEGSIERYSKLLSSSYDLLLANASENDSLTQLREQLLPKLVSGQITVKKVKKDLQLS